jgi:hypothetical protein
MDQSTLYVDIENLQEIAKEALTSAIQQWPEEFPKPGIIKLYVKADQTELWRIWLNYNLPTFKGHVIGVQHYTSSGSKNSADLSLALDVIADLLKGRTKHVAIMSDDSDYVSLFSSIKQEIDYAEDLKTMFRWFMTNRPSTRSQMLTDFFPSQYINIVSCSPIITTPKMNNKKLSRSKEAGSEEEKIAKFILQNIPVGSFKSSDCKKIIGKNFPEKGLDKLDSASFGTYFSKYIWPILERNGVRLPNPNRKPRKYEMTEAAKKAS